jgi:hypothetical protein
MTSITRLFSLPLPFAGHDPTRLVLVSATLSGNRSAIHPLTIRPQGHVSTAFRLKNCRRRLSSNNLAARPAQTNPHSAR